MALDYKAWVQRAKNFLRQMHHLPGSLELNDGIEEPSAEGRRDFNASNVPAEVQEFLRTATRRCAFFYYWKIPAPRLAEFQELLPNIDELNGGCDFCEEAKYFVAANNDFLKDLFGGMPFAMPDMMSSMRGNDGTVLAELQDRSRLILKDTPDQLGGAVYSSSPHDPESETLLSSNFDEFLLSWEQICYLSPTRANLGPWLNAGRFQPDRAKAERFRALLLSQNNSREVQP